MDDYPAPAMPPAKVAPVPRRVRGVLDGQTVVDSTKALYVWEWPYYPQYYFPLADVRSDLLVAEDHPPHSPWGTIAAYSLRAGEQHRSRAVKVVTESTHEGLAGTAHFDWAALDAWYEEDEQVFVHPRNPYVRVDALRSTRQVHIELEGVTLARTSSPVMVFETGLPTRYYVNRTEVDFVNLVPSDTVTECPYKGKTSGYWSVRTPGALHTDLAWTYDFPTRQLLPIAGMIGFYNEKVDITLDGERLARPVTHFFRSTS